MSARTLLFFGYHDRASQRQYTLEKTFRNEGYEIAECRTEAKGLWGKYRDLRKQFLIFNFQFAILLVTFPGHTLMPLAWYLTRRPRRKLVFDAFLSLSDTLVSDRKKYSWLNPFTWILYLVDVAACRLADEILIDTEAHKQFFCKRFFLNPRKIRVIYVGTREDIFHPAHERAPCGFFRGDAATNLSELPHRPRENPQGTSEPLHVLFFGTFIPLQGIEHILGAAKILQDKGKNVHFTLIGTGQTKKAMQERAEKLRLRNVTFESRIPMENLPARIRAADVCLGIFGTSGKARRVIPHKVFDAVACGARVITARTPAILEKFGDGRGVILCDPGNPADLADTILAVQRNA